MRIGVCVSGVQLSKSIYVYMHRFVCIREISLCVYVRNSRSVHLKK